MRDFHESVSVTAVPRWAARPSAELEQHGPRALLLVTDLDGCLLDEETYAFDDARPALRALAARGVPLVLASSKTRAEVVPLAEALGLRSPLIVENGGALLVPRGLLSRRVAGALGLGGYDVVGLGLTRRALVAVLGDIAVETGTRVRAFSSLSPTEIQRLTGLSHLAIRRAQRREWDEPFLAEAPAIDAISDAARRRGLRVVQGGRFLHLTGAGDKGSALGLLLDLLAADGRSFRTAAVGNSAHDLSLLERVDWAILIPRATGDIEATLAARLPAARRAQQAGPSGWNDAVLALLGEPAEATARWQPSAMPVPAR
jgi:mannosyl-3-phosphoglycerate phosphatase